MVRQRGLLFTSVLFLFLCISASAVNFGEDDDEDEVESSPVSNTKAVTIQGTVASEQFLKVHKGKILRVLVDDGKYSAIVRLDGSFQVHGVPEGVHFLQLVAPGWHFESVRLEVSSKGSQMRVKAFTNNEMMRQASVPYPLKLAPMSKLNYFVEREKFDILSYLKNPMVLIIGFSMIMAFVMPKMVDNMDEGDKAKLRGQMSNTLQGPNRES